MTTHAFRATERTPGWCTRCGEAAWTEAHFILARAEFIDGSGSEIALRTVSGWVGTRGPIPRSTEHLYTFHPLTIQELDSDAACGRSGCNLPAGHIENHRVSS